MLEPVQDHVELQRPDRGQHGGLVAAQVGGQDLDDALGVQLLDAAAELLGLAAVLAAHHREVLGREARNGRNSTGASPAYSVSPGRSAVALTRPITSPGKASSTVSRSWPNIDCAYFVANGRPVAAWVSTMPRSNRPEHTRTNAIRSRWAGSILACTLNTSPENGAPTGRSSP